MKRIFLGFLLLFAVGIVACGPQTNDKTTAPNVNANVAPSPKSSPTVGKPGGEMTTLEVLVTITIADDVSKNPIIVSVLPEKADLSGGQRVLWLVENNSQEPAGQDSTVVIGPFKGTVNPANTKPFGPDNCANLFTLDFLKEGKQSREISEQAQFQAGELAYSYEVTLKAADGSELNKFGKRPEIIVSGLEIKPGASPKPSPTSKPKK